jgi:phage terminase large subunit-like protein
MLDSAIDLSQLENLSAGQQEKVRQLLKKRRDIYRNNPLLLYRPHPKQRECHEAVGTPTRAFMGGNRAGKTTMGIADDLIQAAPWELLPDRLKPFKRFECPFYCRIIVPSGKVLHPVTVQKLREWTPKEMLAQQGFDASLNKADNNLSFECGCRFDFMTFEQTLDKFGGAALHRCHHDEEPPEDIRQECLMRLIDFDGDELFTMTPLMGMTWMFDAIYGRRHTDPDIKVVLADIDDNPHLSDAAKERALKDLTDEERQARKEGRMVHFEGMVYPGFDKAKVLRPERGLVQELDVIVGIDPGIREAGVVWVGFDGENNAIIFDELSPHDQTVPEIAADIRRINAKWGLVGDKVPRYVIDPAARQRTLTTAVSVETFYHNEDIYPGHGQNDVEAGITDIRRRIKDNSLQVSQDCGGVLWEAERYRQQMREDGKYDVVKEKDHKMDAARYALMERPWSDTTTQSQMRSEPWLDPDNDVAFPHRATRRAKKDRAPAGPIGVV